MLQYVSAINQEVDRDTREIMDWIQKYADRVQPLIEQVIQNIIDAIITLP